MVDFNFKHKLDGTMNLFVVMFKGRASCRFQGENRLCSSMVISTNY